MTTKSYDLVVIGMGAAGLSAAVSYAETATAPGQVARIAMIERSPENERGGSTRYTSSWFRVTEDRQLDPKFVDTMESISGGLADLDYCRTLVREVPNSLRFLDEHDVQTTYFKQGLPNRNTGGGLGMPVGGGAAIVQGLAGIVERTDGSEILYETEAVRLSVSEEGRIDGVVVRGRDGLLRRLDASSVVIASGGFEGNKEMLTQYLGERACDMPLIAPGPGNNRGDGIRMAIEIGADMGGQFDMFHGEPVDPRTKKPDAVIYPYPYGIVVNRHARRFYDEGKNSFDSTFEEFAYEIWRYQEQRAFFIGDQTSLSVRALPTWCSPICRQSQRTRLADLLESSASIPKRSMQRSPSTTQRWDRGRSIRTSSTASAPLVLLLQNRTGRSHFSRRPISPTR